jgi:2-polyprenyl-3-methyl-5-hydroxy-6-metoxy-1,4-benzoquinol methylase
MYKCEEHLGCSGDVNIYSRDGELGFDICKNCGVIWRTSDSMNISKPYEQVYFDSKNYKNKRDHKVKKSGWLIDLARINHPNINNILEVGCSIGYTLQAAKNRNIDHLGIDISSYAIESCRDLGLNAENSSFDDLKQRNRKYDLIFMQHVLEHFEDPFLRLSECNDLLNDNGLVLILVPNSKYIRASKHREKHRFYSKSGVGAEHFAYFNYDNLTSVLRVCGFEVIQKNYPVFIKRFSTLEFFANRIFRRSLSFFNSDQEILVIARKTKK